LKIISLNFSVNLRSKAFALPAVGALDMLMELREVESWKKNGVVIGVPALTSAPQAEKW
jgi:hypothetical protein